MSFQALGWAVDQKPKHPVDKLLLLGLADRHNTENKIAWPSVAWLVEFSGLDRKTVITGLQRLQDHGMIADSGKRAGRTKQIVAYALSFDTDFTVYGLSFEAEPKVTDDDRIQQDATGDNRIQQEGSQKRNGSVFPPKGSQKRDTEPIKEPPSLKASPLSKGKTRAGKRECPDDFWPDPTPGTVTHERQAGLTPDELRTEVEAFIAYHQTRENKYASWQKCWTTWMTNNFRKGNTNAGNGKGGADGPTNPMVRAAIRLEAERRSGLSQ